MVNDVPTGGLDVHGKSLMSVSAVDWCPSRLAVLLLLPVRDCCAGISGGTYGVVGLSLLAMVTKKPEHIAMVRTSMDFMLAWQWAKEINTGWYDSKVRNDGQSDTFSCMPRVAFQLSMACVGVARLTSCGGVANPKARFQGADMKTAGASVNGMVRSEVTLHSWMAYKVRALEQPSFPLPRIHTSRLRPPFVRRQETCSTSSPSSRTLRWVVASSALAACCSGLSPARL